MSFFYWKLG